MCGIRIRLVAIAAAILAPAAQGAEFPLKDGDTWVMAGDSITAQHLHSNYFEAFCFARYPKLKFAFRNSGVGGHTISSTLARYEYDIHAWNPTIVSVELGMNDQGGTTPEQYIVNMTKMVERIRSGKARPVMLTASPVNNGNTMANLSGNKRLHDFAVTLEEFSKREAIPFADQFHQLIDVWGNNKPRETLANTLPTLRSLAQQQDLAGVENLKAFLAAQEKVDPQPISMQGDPVHPGAPGQLMMAAALLKDLGAESFVSSASLDATGKLSDAKECSITNIKLEDGTLSFDRTDSRLPFPIPENTAGALPLFPTIAEMSKYLLQVNGLMPGMYVIKVNGVALPTSVSEKSLAEGVNLTSLAAAASSPADANAIIAQGRAILNAVGAKEGLVGQWRGLSQRAHAAGAEPKLKDELAELTQKVLAADEKIREAARPATLRFEVTRKN